MKKALSYIKILLAIYLAFHFVSNAAFVHNHIIDGESISHAHPFTGKQHNANDAAQIQHFNASPWVNSIDIEIPECIESYFCGYVEHYDAFCPENSVSTLQLRGPPSLF